MTDMRTEHDLLGERSVPADVLWGIHTLRARENFPLAGRAAHSELVKAFGAVKLAAARVNRGLGAWNEAAKAEAIERACSEMNEGLLGEHVVVDALQGGAGTSTNMNVNEVLANRALQILGHPLGRYDLVSPHDDINMHQSTNDTYPTALRVAAIRRMRELEQSLVSLQEAFQVKEREYAGVVKVGRTELRDAVLTTMGRAFGAYAEAFNRDRWRIYKCEERLRVVNLGGTAIGTGLGAPRRYIFRVVDELRSITGLGLARSENLIDATQNMDALVEVSGMLTACASSLTKVCGDLRLLSSGPDAGLGELMLPEQQPGSSIMPGKVNPVIPEGAAQAAMLVMGHHGVIAQAASAGNLELNQFAPLIAHCLLESCDLLIGASGILRTRCVEDVRVDEERCRGTVAGATAAATALIVKLGYERAAAVAAESRQSGRSIRAVAVGEGLVSEEEFDSLVSAEAVCRLGMPDGPRARGGRGRRRGER